MYNPKVTLMLHKCHSILTLLSPSDKRKAPRVSPRSILINPCLSYRLRFACSYHNPCRIRHSNPIIIQSTRHPLDSILPCAAPEDLTLTRSAAGVSYFIASTEENLINESDHDVLSISCFDGLIIHTNPPDGLRPAGLSSALFGHNKSK